MAQAGGTFPTNSQLTNESAASLRLYAQLIDLLDMVVDVDILSGTSAGGINAALLASSRVTGSDLGGIRDLWLDLGALTELLRDPRDKKTPSLLYGDERIFAALAKRLPKLATGPFPPTTFPEAARTPSTTLYITTTLLAGETSRFTDSFGTLVQDVDRRGLFTFTETDLARPDTAPALALAARSSASFPLAFEPSFLPFTKGTAKKGEVPARPAMAPFTSLTRPHWVSDGGLLDNRPIGVLFKRIFDRPARRPVRRVLLFVVPSSGPAPDPMHEPPPDNVDEPLRAHRRAAEGPGRGHHPVDRGRPTRDPRPSGLHGSAHRCQTAARRAGGNAAERHTVAHPVPAHGLPDPRGNQAGPDPHQRSAAPAFHLSAGVGPGNRKPSQELVSRTHRRW